MSAIIGFRRRRANQDRRVYSPVVLRLPAGARGGEVGAPTAAAPTPTAYATSEERRADIRPPSSSVSSPAMARFTLDHPADDPHRPRLTGRLNWLRAGILGANDGIVSVASIVVGVAAAANETGLILTAGAAALVGGAVSMALGEYVSVSSQRDTERSLIARQRLELETMPADELAELAHVYEARGLSPDTARLVAREMTAHDPLATHLEVQFGIDQGDLVSPWHAALASGIAFTIGGLLPLLAMLAPAGIRIPLTFVVVLIALPATGAIGARVGDSPMAPAAIRVLAGGALALVATFLIGNGLGTLGVV